MTTQMKEQKIESTNTLWKIVFTKSSFPYEYGEFENKMSCQDTYNFIVIAC